MVKHVWTGPQVYFQALEIHPIHLLLTLHLEGGGALESLPTAVQSLGVTFGNIERAPIQLRALFLGNEFDRADEISNRIFTDYVLQIVARSYKVLGAAEFLGNPVNFVSHINRGLSDLLYLPARGMVTSPHEAVAGLTLGTESLIRHTMLGTLGSVCGITSTVGKGFAKLSGDAEYQSKVNKLKAKHPDPSVLAGDCRLSFCVSL